MQVCDEATIIQKSTLDYIAAEASHGALEIPFKLKLSKRIEMGDKAEVTKPADPKFVLYWEEFFMGLAQLQCVYCNDDDPNPKQKVSCRVNISV